MRQNNNKRKPAGYWDNYDNCYEEAKKYESKVSFQKGNNSAYNAARKNKWIDKWFGKNTKKPSGYWNNYDNCKEEALKYKTRGEFSKANISAYIRALKYGWLDEWFGEDTAQKPSGYWNYDTCYNEALKYEKQSDFRKYSSAAYCAARKNGWIKDYHWLKKNVSTEGPWLIYAYEDPDNKVVYVGLTNNMNNRHSKHKCGLVKNGVRKFDVLAKYWQSIGKPLLRPRIKMEDLDTKEDAQYYEDWYKQKYAETGWKVLNIGPTGIGKSSLGGCNRKWTEETIKEVAENCVSRNDFYTKYSGAARAANDLGIMEKLFPERLIKPNGFWMVYDNHLKEIEGCKSKKDYERKNRAAYVMAIEYGFIDKLFPENIHRAITNEELEEARNYKDRNDLSHNNRRLYMALYKRNLLDEYYPIKKVG